jgi:hypothetical protein
MPYTVIVALRSDEHFAFYETYTVGSNVKVGRAVASGSFLLTCSRICYEIIAVHIRCVDQGWDDK